MTVRVPHAHRLRMYTVLLCAFTGAGTTMFGQSRDLNAERFIMDDNGSDGTRHTLTLQAPGTGLSANRTLTFPDGDGVVLTLASGSLVANQILFGGPTGQAAQSAGLAWDNSTGIFSIGAGSVFTVDGSTGNTVVAGGLDVQGAATTIGDGTAVTQLTVEGVQDAVGTETLPDAAFDLAVVGDIGATGIIKSGASITIDGVANPRTVSSDDAMNIGTSSGDLGLSGDNVNVSTLGNGQLFVDPGTTINAPGNGHTMGTAAENALVLTIEGSDGGVAELQVNGDVAVTGNTELGDGATDGVTINGVMNATAAGNAIGDGTDAEQLQISGVDGGAVEVDIDGDADVSGTLTVGGLALNGDLDLNDNDVFDIGELRGNSTDGGLNINTTNTGDVNIGNGSGEINVDANIVPTADNTYALGTDDNRFSQVFVNGGSVHIGESGGEVSGSEMSLGFIGIVGEINVLGGNPELVFNGDAVEIQLDSDGDGTIDAAVTGGGIRVNSGGGANAIYSEDGVSRNGGGAQTFGFSNSGGDLDVTIGGDLDVDVNLNVDGTTALVGAVDAQAAGNVMGDGTDAEQLEVQGVAGGAVEVDVDGDMDVSGTLTVGTLAINGDLDMNQNDIVDLGNIEFSTAGSNLSNTAGNVTIDDDADLSGALQIGGASAVTNSRLVINNGHLTSQQTTAPTAAPAGANVTSAILSNHTDVAGVIDITSSGAPAAGAQATVTFDTPYATAPVVVMMAANGPAAGVGAYVTRTTGGFTVNFIGLPAASTSHQFYYQVIETQ